MKAAIAGRLGPARTVPAIAAAVVLITLLAVWLGAGVTLGQACRFGAYEVLYVFLPGWILHEALRPGLASGLRRTLFAFALGQVVEILLFALTAGLGARWLFTLYPLAFLLAAAAIRFRRPRANAAGAWAAWRVDPGALPLWSLALAAVCLLSLATLVLTHFLTTPLPGTIADGFTYQHDYLFHLSLAGEALHHWPLTNPNVSGTDLNYHWFSYLHMAGIAQVTDVPLPTVYFALFQAPLLLLLLAELALAGATLGGRLWAGPIAALMLIFVGEIDFSKPELAPFLEVMPIYIRYSPAFLFGATMFVPLILILCETLQTKRPSRGQWGVIALLAVGCAGSEATILPLVAGGIAAFLGCGWLTSRSWDRRAIAALGLTSAIFLLAYVVLYAGGGSGLGFSFPGAVQSSPPFSYALPYVPAGIVRGLFWVGATLVLVLFLFGATAIGLLWLPRRLRALRAQEVVPLGIFVCGILAIVFLFQESDGERYFGMYGVIAVIPISAGGLARLLSRWRGASRTAVWTAAALAAISTAAFAAAVFDVRLGANPDVAPRYLRPYLFLVVVVAVLSVWAWRSSGQQRRRRALYPVLVVLAAAVINVPTDYRSWFGHLWSGESVQAEIGPGLSPSLFAGLRWIEGHTDEDAVLAVDDLRTETTRIYAPLYFYVSAFAERRTLMQGWEYSTRGAELGATAVGMLEKQPFPERLRLEDAVFERASLPALRELRSRFGVTDLVVYRENGRASARLRRIARLVYSNPAILVYVPRSN